ncbi:MAG: hypothetical protein Q4D90_00985 [bacterium]|nr:hypothetical protein [bacterium]
MRKKQKVALLLGLSVALLLSTSVWSYAETEASYEWSDEELDALGWSELEEFAEEAETDTAIDIEEMLGDASDLYEVVEEPPLELFYDTQAGMYRYELPNASSFWISVPLGAQTTHSVRLNCGNSSAIYNLTKDGEYVSQPESLIFTETGSYQMMLMNTGSFDASKSGNKTQTYQLEIAFVIYEDTENQTDFLQAPLQFRIAEARKDGLPWDFSKDRYQAALYLEEDGYYQVRYVSEQKPEISYQVELEVDRQAPYLTFSKSIYEKKLRAPLSFEASERGGKIQVWRNDVPANTAQNSITDGGFYRIEVADEAGNTREYQMYVAYGSPIWSKGLVIAAAGVLLVVAVWLLYQRRHMQVL